MISIPTLNAWISCGDFVHARNAAYNNQLMVCQINEVHSSTLSLCDLVVYGCVIRYSAYNAMPAPYSSRADEFI
jgi:hypothetical protein